MINFVDLYSLELHRAVAEKMVLDGEAILRLARSNLDRWLNSETFASGPERNALLEWKEILDQNSVLEIRGIITAETDEGQRLRSSSPFAGVLTPQERKKTWSECAEVGLA